MAAYYGNTVLYLEWGLSKEARMDYYSQSLHYGYGVFEGIRSTRRSVALHESSRREEHFQRLRQSAWP